MNINMFFFLQKASSRLFISFNISVVLQEKGTSE